MIAIGQQQADADFARNQRGAQARILRQIGGEALCEHVDRCALAPGFAEKQRMFHRRKPASALVFRHGEREPAHLAKQAALIGGHIRRSGAMQPVDRHGAGQKVTGGGGNFRFLSVRGEIHWVLNPQTFRRGMHHHTGIPYSSSDNCASIKCNSLCLLLR